LRGVSRVFGSLANEYKITPDNGDAVNVTYDVFSLYVDDVSLSVAGESEWTEESCLDNGVPYNSDVTAYYDIRQLKDDTTGHHNAWQLSVAKEGATKGVVFYSKPIDIDYTQTYKTTFDYKIEGIDDTNGSKLWKIMYLVRYLDSAGNPIYDNESNTPTLVFAYRLGGFDDDYGKANTDGWVSDNASIANIPANATSLQIGLTIGTEGTPAYDAVKNVKYSWDNIRLMTEEEYNVATMEMVNSTDLLFIMLQGGNAYSSDTDINVLDLVKMKRYAAGEDTIDDDALKNADINVNTLINNADIELLHWKLLGVDTEAEAALVKGYNFYQ